MPAAASGGAPSIGGAFGQKTLSQAQIADIEAYILHLNGVDRAQIINPGIAPYDFLYIFGIIFLVLVLCAVVFLFFLRH